MQVSLLGNCVIVADDMEADAVAVGAAKGVAVGDSVAVRIYGMTELALYIDSQAKVAEHGQLRFIEKGPFGRYNDGVHIAETSVRMQQR